MLTKELVKPLFALAVFVLFVVVAIERSAIPATLVAQRLPAFLGGGNSQIPFGEMIGGFSKGKRAELKNLQKK